MAIAALPPLEPPPTPAGATARGVLLGLSGGLDSMVLLQLLATAPWRAEVPLRAIHVFHGLHPAADAWADHCEAACAAFSVPLAIARVEVSRASGLGLEGAARAARHAAFREALGEREVLALAHNADDQAETFLLRALRASGPDGLAAMQAWRTHGAGWLWRPLLDHPRHALLAHARTHGLQWIEDPSNSDTTLDRNFLRHEVMPLLARRWPGAGAAFARSAVLCAEAAQLLEADDAQALASVRIAGDTLDAGALASYPPARRARVLRRWCADLGLPPLPGNGVVRIESEGGFEWAGARIRRWRALLHAGPVRPPLPVDWSQPWTGEAPLPLPGGGGLQLLGAARFDAPLRVHARRGGERIRLPGRKHGHALKQVLQDAGMPPWLRERLPLLSDADGTVLAAGDRIVAAPLAAWLEANGARLAWTP